MPIVTRLRRFQLVGPSNSGITGAPPDQVYEIIGVVGDAKYLDLRGAPPRTIYLNAFQEPRMFATQLALKTKGPQAAVAGEVRRIVRARSSFFGGLGASLAALGLYGLLAYTVTRRTNEIGIRIALGAAESAISHMVLRGAFGLVCTGLVIGVPLAFLGRRAASRVVTDLPVDNVWPLVLAVAAMLAIALVAAFVPARLAARVDPVAAIRRSAARPSSFSLANPNVSTTSSIERDGCCWLWRPRLGSWQGQSWGQSLQRLIALAPSCNHQI